MRLFSAAIATFWLVLLLGFPLTGYAFFTASEIADLKNTPLPADRSVTIGKLFDTYQYCEDGKWTLQETDRGQKYVEFRGKYSNLSLVLSRVRLHFRGTPDSAFKEIARSLDSSGFTVELVARFMIAADGKTYQTVFLGFDYKGEMPRVAQATMERGIRQIHRNEHFTESLPNSGIKSFDYHFKKYVLNKADKGAIRAVTALHISNKNFSVPVEKSPIVIYQLDGIKYDDQAEQVALTVKGTITDKSPENTATVGYYYQNAVSYSSFAQENLQYGILQEFSMNLFSAIKDDELRLADFRFVSPDRRSDASEVQFVLKELMPVRFEIQTMRYEGALSEQVKVFIKRQYDALNTEKQNELAKAQEQKQAHEAHRRSLLAGRDTPYTGPGSKAHEEKKEQENTTKQVKEKEARSALLGTYTNKTNGTLVLSASNKQDDLYHVTISAMTRQKKQCNFEGECTPNKNGGFICKVSNDRKGNSILLKANKDTITFSDYEYAVERICKGTVDDRSYKKIVSAPTQSNPSANPKCPDKILGTKTISGTYLGWFEAEDGPYTIGIKRDTGEEVFIISSQEEAEKYFGTGNGQRISVTYKIEQMWLEEGNECFRTDVLVSGKKLESASPSPANIIQGESYIGYVEDYQEAGMAFLKLKDNQEREILFLGAAFEVEGSLGECINKALEGEYPIIITGKIDDTQTLIKDASVTCQKYTGQ